MLAMDGLQWIAMCYYGLQFIGMYWYGLLLFVCHCSYHIITIAGVFIFDVFRVHH